MLPPIGHMLRPIWWVLIKLFRSRVPREAVTLTLRGRLNLPRRLSQKRRAFSNIDGLVFLGSIRLRRALRMPW